MDVERRRDTRVDVSQERQKLQMPMPGLAWREALAMLHIRAAKSVVVPCRVYACVTPSTYPSASGRLGWVRSSAWI